MTTAARHLRLIPPTAARAHPRVAFQDLGLTLFIFLVAALPPASAILGVGEWDQTSLGVGTVGVVLAGRELVKPVARRRARSSPP